MCFLWETCFRTSHQTPLITSSFTFSCWLLNVQMSSMSKTPSSNNMTSTESPEESGWTKYFEDFFNSDHNNNNNIHDQKCSISFSGLDHSSSSSLVSDAVSLAAAKKFTNIAQAGSFKKRKKIKTTLVDEDDLMDTASSPINSPKVLYENQFSKANGKEEMELYQEKGNRRGERDGEKGLGFNERDSDCTELKKKGLCLVPLSLVTNYLG